MPVEKSFNLLRYVYGELFLNSLNKTAASITVEKWKVYAWRNILLWLNERQYIMCMQIEYVSPTHQRISYMFNDSSLLYSQYILYLKRLAE